MYIIDAHIHLPSRTKSFTVKKIILLNELKRNGVKKGIVISDSEEKSNIGTASDCAELFKRNDNIYVIFGMSPLNHYENQLALTKKYFKNRKIIGIKLYTGHEKYYLTDPRLNQIFKLAKVFDVPVLFHSGWDNAQYSAPHIIKSAAEKHSDIKFVCCHCCYPRLPECFSELNKYENVYFDISSVFDDLSKSKEITPILEKAIHSMPDRFIFGSDYACCSQKQHIELAMQLRINNSEREKLFRKNAEQLYKI